MHHGDVCSWQRNTGIECSDFRRVPFSDLAQVDHRDDFTGHLDLARLDAFQVHYRHDAAHNGRELQQAFGFQLFCFQRHVGCTEIDGLGLDLLDTAARAD